MEREVARVPGLAMRALTGGDTADAQRDALLASGWTQVWSLRGMDPWMRETP
jgi:hypothetical protein